MEKVSETQLMQAFEAILADKDIAKAALKDPGQALSDQGVKVDGIDVFNHYIFELWPDLKKHLLAASREIEVPPFMVSCASSHCIICKAGMLTAGGAAIAACLVARSATCIVTLAKVYGKTVRTMEQIFSDCDDVVCIINKLCDC